MFTKRRKLGHKKSTLPIEYDEFPRGAIILWYGNSLNIPANWAICDGTNGTPDLRNKFVVGATADSSGNPASNIDGTLKTDGGSNTHQHSIPQVQLTPAQVPSITASLSINDHADHKHELPLFVGASAIRWHTSDGNNPFGGASTTLTLDVVINSSSGSVQGTHALSNTQYPSSSKSHTGSVTINQSASASALSGASATNYVSTSNGVPPFKALYYIMKL
jgi:hypothetical protein